MDLKTLQSATQTRWSRNALTSPLLPVRCLSTKARQVYWSTLKVVPTSPTVGQTAPFVKTSCLEDLTADWSVVTVNCVTSKRRSNPPPLQWQLHRPRDQPQSIHKQSWQLHRQRNPPQSTQKQPSPPTRQLLRIMMTTMTTAAGLTRAPLTWSAVFCYLHAHCVDWSLAFEKRTALILSAVDLLLFLFSFWLLLLLLPLMLRYVTLRETYHSLRQNLIKC